MSNLARKLQEQRIDQQQSSVIIHEKVVKKRKITKGEKFLYILFAAVVCLFSVKIVGNQANIYEINKDVQSIQTNIMEQQKSIQDLEAKVSELSEYSRILKEAKKQGLNFNDQNVKVVQNR